MGGSCGTGHTTSSRNLRDRSEQGAPSKEERFLVSSGLPQVGSSGLVEMRKQPSGFQEALDHLATGWLYDCKRHKTFLDFRCHQMPGPHLPPQV